MLSLPRRSARFSRLATRLTAAALVLAGAAGPAVAQYKVVAPDGRITYTDRPPADGSLKVTPLGQRAAAPADDTPALPLELRRISARFPVVLFSAPDCTPCETGRQMLQARGIPYAERLIVSAEDVEALERSAGGRTLPALTVGGQALRGYSEADWASYLDAAGYPRQSVLPRGWTPPAPTPLVARAPAPQAPAPAAEPEAAPAPAPAPSPAPGAEPPIRF